MADFALWSAAAEPALRLPKGTTFLGTYAANRETATTSILEDSLVASVLHKVLESGTWTGTATELLHALELCVAEKDQRAKTWPKSARQLSGQLRRLSPSLRQAGLEVEFTGHEGRDRRRTIRLSSVPTVPSVHTSDSRGIFAENENAELPDSSFAASRPAFATVGLNAENGNGNAGRTLESVDATACAVTTGTVANDANAEIQDCSNDVEEGEL
jgi:hypothetical protein